MTFSVNVVLDCMKSLILCLQLMPAVYNVKKASFDSKLDRLFHFVKVIKVIKEYSYIF
jgi:hypothetical protein